jgi:hypothetical protein
VTLAAGDLRPRQAQVVTQRFRQRAADRDVELVAFAVDEEVKQRM